MNILIHTIDFGTPEYDEAVRLRFDVLRAPLGLNYTPEQLAEEYDQVHLAGFDRKGAMVAYLNLTPASEGVVKMRQVAVAPAWHGKGVGSMLVAESEKTALSLGFSIMTLHARETAVSFYERLGYSRVGERFEEVTIPHFKMEKTLGR
ncbi:MAG: GNAT family N-acetyltransferase [Saprospiraceae bacterium]|nr:GNAT family N-acetyltransferase [Saprospiraceae bacterium]